MTQANGSRAEAASVATPTWRTHDLPLGGEAEALAVVGREWLLTNGTGAYAMGTAAGIHTRRYHGLFVAATRPPVGRVVILNDVNDWLEVRWDDGEATFPLSSFAFLDDGGRTVFNPGGHRHLARFQRGLSVAWTFACRGLTVERTLELPWKSQVASLKYRVTGLDSPGVRSARLVCEPMMTLRDFHHEMTRDSAGAIDVRGEGERVEVKRHDVAATLHMPGATWVDGPNWWFGLYYAIDAERGQGDREDWFTPGRFETELTPADEGAVRALTTTLTSPAPAAPEARAPDRVTVLTPHRDRVRSLLDPGLLASAGALAEGDPSEEADRLATMLAIAADDLVADRVFASPEGASRLATILAGYPWFADWGRDTFIALHGILLTTGRYDEARRTLQAFASAIHNGLTPNRFDDYTDTLAHYNTVDASLWFVQAALRYRVASGDEASWEQWLAEACVSIIDAYVQGTDFSIRVAGDGLVTAGNAGTQLTWMDAAAGGVVFTPRYGKAVEINALWHACLVGLSESLPDSLRAKRDHYKRLAGRAKRAFAKVFWNEQDDCLYDHVRPDEGEGETADATIRPNQVFAAALAESPIPKTKRKQVLDCVRAHLLTPFGLRTLPPEDPAYHGRYRGDGFARDEAYHQGTVWPWLIGPYAEGVLRVGGFSDAAKREAVEAIAPLLRFMDSPGVGQLYEIHEGDPPHHAVGAMAQAWSVAEVLRVLELVATGS